MELGIFFFASRFDFFVRLGKASRKKRLKYLYRSLYNHLFFSVREISFRQFFAENLQQCKAIIFPFCFSHFLAVWLGLVLEPRNLNLAYLFGRSSFCCKTIPFAFHPLSRFLLSAHDDKPFFFPPRQTPSIHNICSCVYKHLLLLLAGKCKQQY